ncbi:hypothetical protein A0H81_04204 [Grifola frondosa]|uniref:Uncharacterized protein n=1 Tax=Grifola frondosa TaxID=5627 RepID=A0A1C7MFH4_GRIFR|nr:hypothetical protein A0H81_04204 [Grifola frondosa]
MSPYRSSTPKTSAKYGASYVIFLSPGRPSQEHWSASLSRFAISHPHCHADVVVHASISQGPRLSSP